VDLGLVVVGGVTEGLAAGQGPQRREVHHVRQGVISASPIASVTPSIHMKTPMVLRPMTSPVIREPTGRALMEAASPVALRLRPALQGPSAHAYSSMPLNSPGPSM
jgi:hypothetical protein